MNNSQNLFEALFAALSGNPITPENLSAVVLVLLGLTGLSLVIGLIAWVRSSNRKVELPAEFGRMSNIGGRVEKLERALNEFRTEFERSRILASAPEIKSAASETVESPESSSELDQDSVEPATDEALSPEDEPTETLESSAPAPLAIRLEKTRNGLWGRIRSLFSGKSKIDQGLLDELEAVLIAADLGVKPVASLLADLKRDLQSGSEITEEDLSRRLKAKIEAVLASGGAGDLLAPSRRDNGPTVVLVVGVNGVGKTTTAAKLAKRWKDAGKKVLLVAADTFRAAAVEQLVSWGERLEVPVVSGAADAKPQSVVFDGMKRGLAEGFDVVLIDTAGRLHTKSNLMQELEGIKNIITRHQPDGPHETILVVDGVTGQNALNQAKEFNAAVPLTGLVITKLDGTPKGGIVVAIEAELSVPVRFIGVGEGEEDLRPFNPAEFAAALFDKTGLEKSFEGSYVHAETRRRRREDGTAIML